MGILNFKKPDKVLRQGSKADFHAQFEFKPLEPGFGLTVGNALRRVLLSSLEGYAITSLKMEGVPHEFSTIEGVIEDVTEIVLNLKQLRFKYLIQDDEDEKEPREQKKRLVNISFSGSSQLTGADLQNYINDFEILNPSLVICNMEPTVTLNMAITIANGRGFVPADEQKVTGELDVIYTDSIYTPIKNVQYSIENFRVEQKTDYEKLLIDIETDGSINPQDALTEAAGILIKHFVLFSDGSIGLGDGDATDSQEGYDDDFLRMRQLLNRKLSDMELSVRALNCLKTGEVETLADLVACTKSTLMKFRNFGKKSLVELEELVQKHDLELGMDLSQYNLDKD